MADRQAIHDLFMDYAWAMDARDFDLLADVFHEDASFTIDITGADSFGPFEPGSGVVEFISSLDGYGAAEGWLRGRRHVGGIEGEIADLALVREPNAPSCFG